MTICVPNHVSGHCSFHSSDGAVAGNFSSNACDHCIDKSGIMSNNIMRNSKLDVLKNQSNFPFKPIKDSFKPKYTFDAITNDIIEVIPVAARGKLV